MPFQWSIQAYIYNLKKANLLVKFAGLDIVIKANFNYSQEVISPQIIIKP